MSVELDADKLRVFRIDNTLYPYEVRDVAPIVIQRAAIELAMELEELKARASI
jgi:hypothetical protein